MKPETRIKTVVKGNVVTYIPEYKDPQGGWQRIFFVQNPPGATLADAKAAIDIFLERYEKENISYISYP